MAKDWDDSEVFEWEEILGSSADVFDDEEDGSIWDFEGVLLELCCLVVAGAWACDGVAVGAGLELDCLWYFGGSL